MDLFAGIKTFIFMLSNGVLYPALLLLAGLSAWMFFECGGLLADYVRRKRLARDGKSALPQAYRDELKRLFESGAPEEDIQRFLRQKSMACRRRLDKFRLAARSGPALGLVGTLVPMGNALASLGQGDLSVMTGELVVAYTTTVVGLVIGMIAYFICTVRGNFAENDILEMEYVAEKLSHEVHAKNE